MLRAAELDISASCIAEGVFTLCLFTVTGAVVKQSVREVGSCSLDIKVRYCRLQGRRRRRGVRLKVGGGGGSVELVEAGRPVEVVGGPIAKAGTCGVDAANPLWAAVR